MTLRRLPTYDRKWLLPLCAVALFIMLTGCASKHPTPPPGARASAQKSTPMSAKAAGVIRAARLMVGAPYKWGGESPNTGFDCSGLVWFSYRQHGINLPRISYQQFNVGTPVKGHLRPGDLVFYKVNKSGKSLHVGIVTDRGTFVHAPSSGKRVMESPLNTPYWRDHYIGARRVL